MTSHKRYPLADHPLAVTAMIVLALAFLVLITGSSGAQSQKSYAPQAGVIDSGHSVTLNREVFQYTAAGRRDPFLSLVKSSELHPTISDLRLTTIAFDPLGQNSVAVLRDIGTKEQYRVDQKSVV